MKKVLNFFVLMFFLALPAIAQASSQDSITAYNYTIQFYPRWYTWTQLGLSSRPNTLVGPSGMSPLFKVIVAVNDDTVYAGGYLDLSVEPQIVTIPPYPNIYSVLILDVFGNILVSAGTPTSSGATYALVGPNYTGTLPAGIIPVNLPYNSSEIFIRTDKYSPQGVDLTQAANNFRAALQMQSLSKYKLNPTGGQAIIAPLGNFVVPIKRTADSSLWYSPTDFLNTLQQAMASPSTQPLTAADQALIAQFNSSFNAAKQQTTDPNGGPLSDIIQGAQAALTAIIDHWRSNTGPTRWVHPTNMGHWGTNYLDRASANEYIQYGNDSQAAYYAHAFVDANDIPLDGGIYAYTITFTTANMPAFSRFASITAYTPEDIELVSNSLNKYVVASYTPGLVFATDGSVTFYVQPNPPTTAPLANWLPIPAGPFNLMLRIYGPLGNALDGTYLPPAIQWGFPY